MMHLTWSNKLENLAGSLFELFNKKPLENPLAKECIIVNSPTTSGWLKHYFLYEQRGKGKQRVLANWDIQYLYVFVNDWLFLMTHPNEAGRDARLHPYSRDCLSWRIFNWLDNNEFLANAGKPVADYLQTGNQNNAMAQRRKFDLAVVLARLFDDYQVYRPDVLVNWENTGQNDWQADLWKKLVDEQQVEPSYLSQFLKIDTDLKNCGIKKTFQRVSVFNIATMPPPYIHFFQQLSEIIDVYFYVFNPCKEQWDLDITDAEREKRKNNRNEKSVLQGFDDPNEYLETGNPLLSSLGKGCQTYLAELLDRTGGQTVDCFAATEDDSVLRVVQNDIISRRITGKTTPDNSATPRSVDILETEKIQEDHSIQIHICHSPWREVQVLLDHILKWSAEEQSLQPRHIQVLVSDIDVYAPYIDAVFSNPKTNAPDAVPYVITDRSPLADNIIAVTFMQLLKLAAGRFKATEVVDLLEIEPVREAFELNISAAGNIREWVHNSGIRWGIDQDHLRQIVAPADPDPTVTWGNGLDRILLGYAVGRVDNNNSTGALLDVGDLGNIAVCDFVESGAADDMGKLLKFFHALRKTTSEFSTPAKPGEWKNRLASAIDRFFVNNNETYREIALLRRAVSDFTETADIVRADKALSVDVVAAYMQHHLSSAGAGGDTSQNAVVFSALRSMRATPRRIICLLGMNDSQFPRSDQRPGFDLLSQSRRWADRSYRLDDRHAFLETLLYAQNRLYISYVGRTDQTNEIMPPSTVISELRDYLKTTLALPLETKSPDGQDLLYCETLHRLQAFNPAYFNGTAKLFSYSRSNCNAAAQLCSICKNKKAPEPDHNHDHNCVRTADFGQPKPQPALSVRLDDFLRFFRNPAQYYYKNVLQIRLDNTESVSIPDTELFDPNSLDKYKLHELMLNAQLENNKINENDIHERLKALCLTPLGVQGRQYTKNEFDNVEDHLCRNMGFDNCPTIRAVLSTEQEPVSIAFQTNNISISGEIRKIKDKALHVHHRYADVKAKDYLDAWIKHLMLCRLDNSLETWVVGKDKEARYTPVPKNEAEQLLEKYIALFLHGQNKIPPFAPATSMAYAETINGESEDKSYALSKAAKEWESGYNHIGDDADPYLFLAFDENGPMNCDGFAETAKTVFDETLLDMITDPSGSGPEKRDNDADTE